MIPGEDDGELPPIDNDPPDPAPAPTPDPPMPRPTGPETGSDPDGE